MPAEPVTCPPSRPADGLEAAEALTLAARCGLAPPRPSLSACRRDPHLALALALAVPVWTALGLLAAPRMFVPSGVAACVSLVVAYPFMEELLFRGVLQGEVLRLMAKNGAPLRLGPVSWANLLASAAFVAFHFAAQPLAWALAVAAPSLILGHLRERFDSVWPGMFVHAVYNIGFALAAGLAGS